jgi:Zn-dependent M28 family amino/carboxypeptidase
MPFITFIYKVGKNNKTYYGKYCNDYISDDHDGLDNEVKYELKKGLNKYRKQNNNQKIKSKIIIGVLSFSSNDFIPTYSSDNEIKCFDFYRDYDKKLYINGKVI